MASTHSSARIEEGLELDQSSQGHEKDETATTTAAAEKEKDDVLLVDWDCKEDRTHPHRWPFALRVYLTFLACWVVMASTFTSSITSGVAEDVMRHFGFGQELLALTISIFVSGYILGPWLWGPLSEHVGRRAVFTVSLFLYTCWNVGCALAPNTAALLVFRFLAGSAAAAPLSNSGGLIADLWPARVRGIATGLYACAPFAAPALSPIVSGFIQTSGTNFRWAFWVCVLYAGTSWLLVVLTMRETYAPVLLKQKAKGLRKNGISSAKAPMECKEPLTVKTFAQRVLLKPLVMTLHEPMLLASIVYLAFLYGVLYLLFEALPIVFGGLYGFDAGIVGLTFLPFTVGAFVGMLLYVVVFFPLFTRKLDRSMRTNGTPCAPEERLPLAMLGAPVITIGFFWFAWTSQRKINFWSPLLATSLLGFGIFFVFQGLFNFLIDAYTQNAASALAAGVIVRSCFGAAFPLFARQMYDRLGIQWASTLLGFFALLLTPIPFVLYRYGPRLRALSRSAK